MTLPVLVVDLDGTLIDFAPRSYRCYREILDEHGATPLSFESFWNRKRERASQKAILEATGSGHLADVFRDAWLQRIEDPRLLALDEVLPGVREGLEAWRTDFRVVLATLRQDPEALHDQLDHLHIRDCLDLVVRTPSRLGAEGKAGAVLNAVKQNGWPMPLVWIGDTELDVEAGRVAGAVAWVVTCGIRSHQRLLEAHPDLIASNVPSLPNPQTATKVAGFIAIDLTDERDV